MPTIKPVLMKSTMGANHGWSFLLESCTGAPPVLTDPHTMLAIDGVPSMTKRTLSSVNLRLLNGNDYIVQLPFAIRPPSTATNGGGLGDIRITIDGTATGPVAIGYGE